MTKGCPVCKKPSSTSPHVRPFCCVAHRSKHTRDKKRRENERFMATRAKPGDLVDNNGVVCCVKTAASQEISNTVFKQQTCWDSTFIMYCGQEVEVPKALEHGVLTCLACISEGAKCPVS